MEEVVKKEYKCEYCGKVFNSGAALGGHTSNCKKYYIKQYGSLELYTMIRQTQLKQRSNTILEKGEEKRNLQNQLWIDEKHECERCGKIMTEKFGTGRFCSRSCANSRQHSDDTKQKIKSGVLSSNSSYVRNRNYQQRLNDQQQLYYQHPNVCKVCGVELEFDKRKNSTCCSIDCIKAMQVEAGRASVQSQGDKRRSKSEILFYQLCKDQFTNVEHNVRLFNGWDADIIIHDIKYAILWNGIWHYQKIKRNQSLEQIQSRDKIKLQNIIDCGYTPYIIKDLGSFDESFVKEQFQLFVSTLYNS